MVGKIKGTGSYRPVQVWVIIFMLKSLIHYNRIL